MSHHPLKLDLELKHGAVSDTFKGNFSYFQPWISFPCFCQKYVCFQIFNNYLIINTEQMEPFTSQKKKIIKSNLLDVIFTQNFWVVSVSIVSLPFSSYILFLNFPRPSEAQLHNISCQNNVFI